MSGGRWDYGRALEDNTDALTRLTTMNAVLQAIEHEMDWGASGDTCEACSKLRAVAALEQFFDDRCCLSEAAVAVANDRSQNLCPKCREQAEKTRQMKRGVWRCPACSEIFNGSTKVETLGCSWSYANDVWKHLCGNPPERKWAAYVGELAKTETGRASSGIADLGEKR